MKPLIKTVIFILVAGAFDAFAQKSTGENFLNIEGMVVEVKNPLDNMKTGISGAKMILMDKNYKIILSKYTNKQGKFSLQALPNTQYFVIAEKKGYASKRISVTTAAEFSGQQEQVEIELNKSNSQNDDRTAYLKKIVNDANDLPDNTAKSSSPANKEEIKASAPPAKDTKAEAPVTSSAQKSSLPVPVANTNTNVTFKVQFGKFANPAPVRFFAPLQNVEIFREEGFIIYTSGNYRTLFEANAALNEIKAKGYPDAFVTAYLDNKKISTTEAAVLSPKQ